MANLSYTLKALAGICDPAGQLHLSPGVPDTVSEYCIDSRQVFHAGRAAR